VTCVRHSQQKPSNCDDRFSSTLRSGSERYQRGSKMREVWSNHATGHRSLRELPAAPEIGNRWRGIEGGLWNRTRRVGCARQALAAGKLRNPRADRLWRDGRDISLQATTLPADCCRKARLKLSR